MTRIESMFALPCRKLPETPSALADAIEAGLRAFAAGPQRMVTVRGDNIGSLEEIVANLSGATLDPGYRPVLAGSAASKPAIGAQRLLVVGQPIKIFEGELALRVTASNVALHQQIAPDGNLLLVVHRAEQGNVQVTVADAELERVIAEVARNEASKQGITIERVQLDLAPRGLRTLDAKVIVTARKMFLRATLTLSATVSINDALVATISNLNCTGSGAIGTLACAAITPQFARIERRPFALAALPLGEVRMRDIAVAVNGGRIVVTAQFGASAA